MNPTAAATALSLASSTTEADGSFAACLIDWQRGHGRHDLPWQQRPRDKGHHDHAYRVWISEVMLQQTQVQTVIPYFNRFMQRFPDLQSLAGAREQDVLALWSGLGYYQRGRNLLACARAVMDRHAGQLPDTAQALQSLPGIGPSTAAAIAATVFHERVAILDGNVKRVLARVTCAEPPWASPALERLLWREATRRLPEETDSMPVYTQAMMDLGATVCRVKNPCCNACPVRMHCGSHRQGQADFYPRPRKKREVPTRQAYWCVLMNAQGVWLMQQPVSGIWPGLWVPWVLNLEHRPAGWGKTANALREIISIRHAFTHYRLEISAGIFDWPSRYGRMTPPVGSPSGLMFFAWAEALSLALPAPVKKLLLRLCPSGTTSGAVPRRNSRP